MLGRKKTDSPKPPAARLAEAGKARVTQATALSGDVHGGLTGGWIVTFTDGAAGCCAAAFSGTCTIGVPQWLQNVEFRGTRFPHREQNVPEGSEEVSTGTGDTGLFSMILLSGREISIFFFTGRVPAITVRVGAGAGAETSGVISGSSA